VSLNGTTQYVSIGQPSDLAGDVTTTALTIGFWFQAATLHNAYIIGQGTASGPSYRYAMGIFSNGKVFAIVGNNGGSPAFPATPLYTAGQWRHLVLSMTSSGTGTLYLDGASISSITAGANNGPTTVDWLIGALRNSNNSTISLPYGGLVDEVTIWSVGLSAAEVSELYNSGTPLSPWLHSRYATLIHHYCGGELDSSSTMFDRGFAADGTLVASPSYSNFVAPDTTPPTTTIDTGPSSQTESTTATFTFHANEVATFECKIDGGAYSSCTSPKAYSGLAEGQHTVTVRSTDGTGNVETSPPSSTWTIFINDKSTLFDGVNDQVSLGQPMDLGGAPNGRTITISAWIKPGTFANQNYIITKALMAVPTVQYILATYTDGGVFVYAGALSSLLGGDISGGGWHHVCFVMRAGADKHWFLDGTELTGIWTVGSMTTMTDWLIGGARYNDNTDSSFNYTGDIDEVSFWSSGLTDGQVTELYNGGLPSHLSYHSAASNLLHWYRMGDGDTYPTITDRKGTANGTMENMTSGVVNFVADTP